MTTQLDKHQKAMLVSITVQSLADEYFQKFGRQPALSDLRRLAALSWHQPQGIEDLVRLRNRQAADTFTRGLEQFGSFREELRSTLQQRDSRRYRQTARTLEWELRVTWGRLFSSMKSLRRRIRRVLRKAATHQ